VTFSRVVHRDFTIPNWCHLTRFDAVASFAVERRHIHVAAVGADFLPDGHFVYAFKGPGHLALHAKFSPLGDRGQPGLVVQQGMQHLIAIVADARNDAAACDYRSSSHTMSKSIQVKERDLFMRCQLLRCNGFATLARAGRNCRVLGAIAACWAHFFASIGFGEGGFS
jgi:hypothetical protein